MISPLQFKTKGSSVVSTSSTSDGGKPVEIDKSTNGGSVGTPEPSKEAMDVDDTPSSSTIDQSNGTGASRHSSLSCSRLT